ncbi:pyridoxal phosphate-dependent aminotransferase [Amycolatopsis alkalitolerans]|uniref:Aminotransferase n=1 Tax=Amycolatopsis alkalitolerans TaxID=2547244 RepID=A0A5C4LRX6_9PSEU|nr:aminotransferase class I/II-fold pyridoxal phosphate-dependent enzyme [Amycolatopsis alkalitolerans]TNC18854.1 aminotransferase class I/II-fold pyridoxal phosphate-dependent enzyme [Amycolatopsis alkalitolerans]
MATSATLAINEETLRRQRLGLPTVPLGFGEAGLPVHPSLAATMAAGEAGYGPAAGIEPLREAAAGYWIRRRLPTDPGSVVAGPGSKALLYAILLAGEGTVALPRPSWVSYSAQAALAGRDVCFVPGQGGVPDPARLDELARARNLRTVVVTLPDNPTGTLAAPAAVEALCEVAERHDLLIVSDEIYRDLVHFGQFRSPAELCPERTVVTTGLSKSLAVGGWRLGVARMPSPELRERVVSIGSEIWSAPAMPVQHAAAWALTEPAELRAHVEQGRLLHQRIGTAVAAVAGTPPPQAAFYLYPDFTGRTRFSSDVDLARFLLRERGIATLPGAAFGDPGLHLRLATSRLYGADDEQRWTALRHPDPASLPWIAGQLERLASALRAASASAPRSQT